MISTPRDGNRPETSNEGPHRQLTQKATPELWGRLIAEVFAPPGTEEASSQVSPVSSRAVFLSDQELEHHPTTSLAPGRRLEPVHLHGVDDTSVHLCLPADRGRELTDLGWAEPHQYEEFGTEFMIYGPRSPEELEAVLSVIEESIAFARQPDSN